MSAVLAGRKTGEPGGNPNRSLTDKQKQLAKALAQPGMSNAAAARMAGYSPNGGDMFVGKLKKDPAFQRLLEAEQKAYTEATRMTAKRVIDGFLRAVELSELKTDSIAMTAAWREIGRLCGYYAPKVVKHEHSLDGEALKHRLREMTDEELMRLNRGENALEGEFEIIGDGSSDMGEPTSTRGDLTRVG